MAQFENVNYTFYHKTLGRSVVPDEETFLSFRMQETQQMAQYIRDGLVYEIQPNGIDSAVCMWIEEDYNASMIEAGDGFSGGDASESIGNYSHSANTRAVDVFFEKNAKSTAAKKYKWLGLFCEINTGKK